MSRRSFFRTFLALVALGFCTQAAAQSAPSATYTLRLVALDGNPTRDQCLIVGDSGYASAPSQHNWRQPGARRQELCGFKYHTDFFANRQAIFNVGCRGKTNECFIENVAVRNGRKIVKCLESDVKTNRVYFRDGSCTYQVAGSSYIHSEAAVWLLDINVGGGTIRPGRAPEKCMIFGNRGRDLHPQLYRWANVPGDTKYCGLGSHESLIISGQAEFSFDKV